MSQSLKHYKLISIFNSTTIYIIIKLSCIRMVEGVTWSQHMPVASLIHAATSQDRNDFEVLDESSLQLLHITICDKINSSTTK